MCCIRINTKIMIFENISNSDKTGLAMTSRQDKTGPSQAPTALKSYSNTRLPQRDSFLMGKAPAGMMADATYL